jgi:hypothetical protein
VAGVLDELKIDRSDLVTHDIGNMVGYAFAAQYPDRVTRFVLIDAPLPVSGRGRRSLRTRCSGTFASADRTWRGWWRAESASISTASGTSFCDPCAIQRSGARDYSELYALPGAMHSGFMQFAAFDQDAIDNQQFLAKGKLPMPVLAIGGEKSFGTTMGKIMSLQPAMCVKASFQTPVTGSWRKTQPQRSSWCELFSMRKYNGATIDRTVRLASNASVPLPRLVRSTPNCLRMQSLQDRRSVPTRDIACWRNRSIADWPLYGGAAGSQSND